MAGASIGPLTLKMVADTGGMMAGLAKASASLSSYAGGQLATLSKLSKASSSIPGFARGGIVASLAKAAGDVYANPVRTANNMLLGGAASIASTVPVVGSALALPLQAIQGGLNFALDAYASAEKNITELGKGAAKTGMSVENFQVFSIMADGAAKAEKAIFKLQQNLATVQFAAVGTRSFFDDLGMDGRKFAAAFAKDAPAALGVFGDKLASLGNPALAAHYLMEALGKSGLELAPMLLKGSAGVEELRAKMDRFGLGVTGGMVASVKEVAKASKDIKMLWDGFSNQIVLAAAPIMAVVSEMMPKLGVGFKGMGEGIINVLDVIGGATARWLDSIVAAWEGGGIGGAMKAAWDGFMELAMLGIDKVGDAMAVMVRSKLRPPLWLRGAVGVIGGLDAMGENKASTAGKDALARLRAEKEVIDGMMPDFGKLKPPLGKLEAGWNALAKMVRDKMAGLGSAADADVFGGIVKRIGDMREAVKGPLDAFRDGLGEIHALLAGIEAAREKAAAARSWGDIAGGFLPDAGALLDKKTTGLAMFKAFSALSSGMPEKKFTGGALKDSTEAYSSIVQHQYGDQNKTLQERIRDTLQEQKVVQEEQARIGQEMLDWFKANPGAVPRGLQ